MSVTAEKIQTQQAVHLEVTVVFTGTEGTVAALRSAGELASHLDGRVTMIVPQVVSYQLPITQPQIRNEWTRQHLSNLAKGSPVETAVRFYLCRDSWQTLMKVLKPNSLIVLGGNTHWWSKESRLARRLRRQGHEVIVAEKE